mgnify:CR=1 FL=1
MILAINQPYFLPYLGYFSLIKHSDQFILFDTPQFIRHGWIERNRIQKQNEGTLYFRVPLVKHKRDTAIKDVKIRSNENWRFKILAQLVTYKKKAPFYSEVIELLSQIFRIETESIVDLNRHSLQIICNYLGIKTPILVWSEMEVEIKEVQSPDEWALNICQALDADTYINPRDGISFFDTKKYQVGGVEIKFLNFVPTEYKQLNDEFIPFLSVIDALMFNDKEQINKMLDNISYVES